MKNLVLLLLLCIVFACSQDDSKGSFDDNDKQQLVRFDVRSISDNLKNNIDVYVFNGAAGVDYDYFNHKVLNIERTEDSLKMRMPVGEWNLVLVGCSESDIRSSLTAPTILNDKSSIVMWETKPQGGYLPDVPEIRTALIDGVEILENQTTEKSALLERNVAKVRVVVVESYGLDNTTSGVEHYVTLNDVPTALAWDGSFYPSLNAPHTGTEVMRKDMTLFQKPGGAAGVLISDTVDFIIPAHKANEATSHRMKLGAYFTRTGGGFWPLAGNNIREIEYFPKANQILLINLTIKAGIEIEVKVEEWEEVETNYDLDELYTISEISHDGEVSVIKMVMNEERAWWVNLADTDNFEFVNTSPTTGQKTSGTLIEVKKKNLAAPVPATLILGISGLEGIDIEVPIFN